MKKWNIIVKQLGIVHLTGGLIMTKKELSQEDMDIIKQYFKDKKIPTLQAIPAGLALKDFLEYRNKNKKELDPLEFIGKSLEKNQYEADKEQKETSEVEARRIRHNKDKLAISLVLLGVIFFVWLYFF